MEVQASVVTYDVDPVKAFEALDSSRSAGVRFHYIYWPVAESNIFTFAPGSTLLTGDTGKGFANDIQTSGGRFANAFASESSTGETETVSAFASWSSGYSPGFGG